MARSTRTSLAGQALSVVGRAIGRKATEKDEPATKTGSTTKAPAKKAPAEKAPAKKAPATAAKPATKAAPAKASTEKAPKTAKAAPAKKAPAKRTPAKRTPATKAPAATRQTSSSTSARQSPQAAAKAVAKKASAVAKKSAPTGTKATALVVKEDEDAWTEAELDEVLTELKAQLEHSVAVLEEQEIELSGLMRDSGDGAGQDQADMGATSFERDYELTVVNSERDKLAQIERALSRIEDGTYGVCESCGQAIGKMRLMAFPRATLCMTCKQREERR